MKIDKNIKFLFRIIIVLGAFIYIGYKLYNYHASVDIAVFYDIGLYEIVLLVIVLGFMLLNWFTESVKWRFLLKEIERISIYNAIRGVFAGLTFSMITPNRTGELVGRVFVLKKENRGEAVVSTIVGSISQSAVTLVMGGIGICMLLLIYNESMEISSDKIYLLIGGSLFLSVFFLFFYFNIRLLDRWFGEKKWLGGIAGYFKVLSTYSQKELLVAFLYSLLRYIIFCGQMILLFHFFKVDIAFEEALIVISATYLVSSIIPSITLVEFGIRGSVIIFFTEIFTSDFIGAFSASIILWVINVAIPAVIGSFIFSKVRL